MTDRSFPKSARVLKQADFDRVFHAKVFAADDVLVVNAAANGLEVTRLGLSVSRKVGNAVVRNHWKRRIREAFRLQRAELPLGMDLVFRPKAGAVCDFAAIYQSLPELARRIARKLRLGEVMLRFVLQIPSLVLIAAVRVYQWTLSPIVGRQCRFQPTCSHYFIGAVEKYGAVRGTLKGLWRICRCHPWGGNGYDPP